MESIEEITTIHRKAMEYMDHSILAGLQGNSEVQQHSLREAFQLEKQAAEKVRQLVDFEPTRSILHRSAASLALKCLELREAEKLISAALAGNPPDGIAGELRDLLEQVNFRRHLELRGISLSSNEFQLSLFGDSVGFGIAPSDQFVERVKDFRNMVFRTAERKQGEPFREKGRRRKKITDEMEFYISVPRAASFVVTFRLGSSDQLNIDGIGNPELILDEVFDGLQKLELSDMRSLKDQISDDAYFRNFVGLAKKIAPDGKNITGVGLTLVRNNQEQQLRINSHISKINLAEFPALEGGAKSELIIIKGFLKYADSTNSEKNVIQIIDENEKSHKISVPKGMMSDIVKPMYEEFVVVTGRKNGRVIELQAIEPDESLDENNL